MRSSTVRKTPLRIIHFGTGGGSGATRVLLDVAAAQVRAGYAVRVLLAKKRSSPPPSFAAVLAELSENIVWVENLWPKFRFVARLREECLRFQPDVFFAHGYSYHLWGRIAALWAKVPTIFHVEHNLERYTFLRLQIGRFLAPKTTATVCVSESVAENARKIGVAAADTRVIVNGADTQRFSAPPVPPPESRSPDIVMAARFSRQKDHETLLRAVALLREQGWRGKLFLAGWGNKIARHKCLKLCATLSLPFSENAIPAKPADAVVPAAAADGSAADAAAVPDAQVIFAGAVADMPALFRRCRFSVLSTHYEGLPLALVEALAAGCVCLGSDVPGVRDVLKNGHNGLLFRAGDSRLLAEQLRELLESPAKCAALAAAGVVTAQEAFSTVKQGENYNALCEELA